MGQQLNPVGIRVGLHRKWKYDWFLDQKYYTNFLLLNFEINKYLIGILRNNKVTSFLINCYVSKISLEKLYICVFFYRLRRVTSIKVKKRKGGHINYKQLQQKSIIDLDKFYYTKHQKSKNVRLMNILNKKSLKRKPIFDLLTAYKLGNIISEDLPVNHKINQDVLKTKIKKIKVKKQSAFILKNNSYKSFSTIKKSLSELTNSKIHLIMINTLSFIKFYEYLHEYSNLYKQNRQAEYERTNLTTQMISFYRYDVKLINDAINIIYITLILKQPLFLAQFIGYQLKKTPRNYRFGKIIQFLSQTITSVVKNRKEILGCRVQFKGRIGGRRSRRARKLQFISEGIMPLHSYTSKIEYGESCGLTRFGTVGIKIWLCYDNTFNYHLQKDLLLYLSYSKEEEED